MDIQIKDESAALTKCDALNKQAQALNEDITNLEASVSRIKEGWASNGMDKESYVLELEKQIRNLGVICDAIRKLSSSISNYINNANQIGNLSVGDSIAGHSVTTGYMNAGNAINGVDSVKLNTNYVNNGTSIRGMVIVGEDGTIVDSTYATGMSIEDFAKANNVSIDRVAIDVGNVDGGLAWVPASTFK